LRRATVLAFVLLATSAALCCAEPVSSEIEHPRLWDQYVVSKYRDPAERSKIAGLRVKLLEYHDVAQTMMSLSFGVWIASVTLMAVRNRRAPERVVKEHLCRLASPLCFSFVPPLLASLGELSALSALIEGEGYRAAVETVRAYGVYGSMVVASLAVAVILVTALGKSSRIRLPFMPKTDLPLSRVAAIVAWSSVLLSAALTVLYTLRLFPG